MSGPNWIRVSHHVAIDRLEPEPPVSFVFSAHAAPVPPEPDSPEVEPRFLWTGLAIVIVAGLLAQWVTG